ncbi:MAG: desA [Burkholderiaceae bacterium]|nr:desA [Burkholderiaceae bacterium]
MSQTQTNAALPAQPIADGQAIPTRKVLRSWLLDLSTRGYVYPIALLIIDLIIYGFLLYFAITAPHWALRLLSGLVMGFWIGRIFIIGHDACHQAYTPNKTLNKVLGRIAFLVSLSPYSLWDVGHNVMHHGFTNLKGVDFVWEPKSREEYAAMTPFQQRMERLYRNGWSAWLYYMVEIWWKKMFWPNKKTQPARRPSFFWDNVLVSVYAVLWIGAIIIGANAAGVNVLSALFTAFVVPFVFWNGMIGIVVYMHHTHEQIKWYDVKTEWTAASPFVTTTVHLTFPLRIGALVHHIMEHTAHHLDATIPLYKLKQTQHRLEEMLPNRIVVQPFSLKWYWRTVGMCQLYDFRTQQWLKFDGTPTTPANA